VAEEGVLYGSVTAADVVDGLHRLGFDVERRQIHLDDHLKQIGVYEVPVRLFGGVSAPITVEVVPQ
jgi:large subunit ribosomal protein L9